ncbi:MAG: kinase/pyrophosphorylase, partial [Parvularculaceae bacterium]|nr:kinase/pyrophosphorylase [Parvularculaceae bacterium]
PTSMYLANRGYKVANIPLVPGVELPPAIDTAKKPLIVGLVAAPERLSQIRETRLGEAADRAANYADLDAIRAEILAAKRLFARKRWPVIDVTRKSVEETASTILTKLSERLNGMDLAE